MCESLASNSKRPIKFVSLNNQLCQARPTLVDINSKETLCYPYTVSVNNCGGSRHTIDDPYSRACVPNMIKNVVIKVQNLISGLNETKYLVQHES